MAYEPTEWKSGDVVTSAKLNKMEQGIVGADAFIVEETLESDVVTLSEKASDIWEAYLAGKHVISVYDGGEGNAVVINGLSFALLDPAGNYTFLFTGRNGNMEFYAENGNENPTYSENNGGGNNE